MNLILLQIKLSKKNFIFILIFQLNGTRDLSLFAMPLLVSAIIGIVYYNSKINIFVTIQCIYFVTVCYMLIINLVLLLKEK